MCSVNVRDDTRAHVEMKRRFLFKGSFGPRRRVQKAVCALWSGEVFDPGIRTTTMRSLSTLSGPIPGVWSVSEDWRRAPALPLEGNRCAESEKGEELILKALEHQQTGEAPTHERAERALRSSRASLNDSLSAYRTAAVQLSIFLYGRTRASGI